MSRIYTAPQCKFEIDGNVIRTDSSIAHKVTGTTMAAILGLSHWATPFTTACNLLGLGREDISNKASVETGRVLESVVVDYLDKRYGIKSECGARYGMFMPADDIYAKREGDHDSWKSDFEDDTFAGHVDGIVMNPKSCEEFILEIKTSSNLSAWTEGVPVYYYWQVALYNEFITRKDRAYVGLGIVDQTTYRNPLTWAPNDRNVVLYEMVIDRDDVREKIEQIREWYSTYILNGTTPEYDPNNPLDVEMFNHLSNLARDVEDVKKDVQTLGEVDAKIAFAEAGLSDLYTARDNLTNNLKEYMLAHNLCELRSEESPIYVSVSKSERTTISKALLMEAGIDPEQYSTKTETNTFRIKKRK